MRTWPALLTGAYMNTIYKRKKFRYYGYKVIPMSKIAKKLSEGVRFLLNIVKNTLPQTVFSG